MSSRFNYKLGTETIDSLNHHIGHLNVSEIRYSMLGRCILHTVYLFVSEILSISACQCDCIMTEPDKTIVQTKQENTPFSTHYNLHSMQIAYPLKSDQKCIPIYNPDIKRRQESTHSTGSKSNSNNI